MRKLTDTIIALMLLCLPASAQKAITYLPVDPELRTGTLPNGLTYYIRHNEQPKGSACFHLVQNVGSILEEEDERGLAHFLEHMCFNGTKHFPGNSMVRFLESNGVKFAADLNAYTMADETLYMIDDVPVGKVSVVDSCLLILRDWCDGLLLDDVEIDKERGVIQEEWRSHEGPTSRMYSQVLPKIYPDSCRYGIRQPIGSMDVVMHFKPQTLRDYYLKWSRPELQGVVIVGDIDPDQIESKVREVFGSLPKTAPDALPRKEYRIPDNKDSAIVAYGHDKAQTTPIVYIYKKQEITPKASKVDEDYEWMRYIQKVMDMMISERVSDMLRSGDASWYDAAIGETDFFLSKTKGAWMGVMSCDRDNVDRGIAELYREMLRIERHGFTQSEYDRARTEYLSQLKRFSLESDRISSSSICSKYEKNYLDGEPMMSEKQEYELVKQISEAVDVSFVNFYCKLMPKANFTVIGLLPEGMAEPDAMAIINSVEAEEIGPYVEPAPIQPLMDTLPESGKSHRCIFGRKLFGYDKYRLSNGATVYIKNTEFNPNQIQIRAFSEGGTSLYGDEDILNIDEIATVYSLGGLGRLPLSEVSRSLTGKQVSLTPEIGSLSEGMYGASTVDDFETLLQLTYLYFTAARSDTTAFRRYIARRRAAMTEDESNPQTALNDSITSLVYGDYPRARRTRLDDLDRIDYGREMQIARERFANAADFTFIFTGHFDEETMMPMIERYIGGLPSRKFHHEKYVDRGRRIQPGERASEIRRAMPTPSAAAVRIYSAPGKYDLRQNLEYELMGQCLNIILMEKIREEMGGTYSISAKASLNSDPVATRSLQTVYQTDPEFVHETDSALDDVLLDFAEKGPSKAVLDQAREYKLKRYAENRNSNAWFSTVLREYLETGVDFSTDYVRTLMSITPEELAAQLWSVIESGNEIRVSLLGFREE